MNTLWLYDVVGDDVTPTSVRNEMAKLTRGQPINVRINSPGGSVFDAVAIHTLLAQWSGGVDVQIDGIAASAASYIATIGRKVSIARDAMVMIHDPWGVTVGNAEDHHSAGEVLDKVAESIVSAYVAKTGRGKAEIRAAMRAETWFTSDGAVEFGLVDVKLGDDGQPQNRSHKNPKLAAAQRQLQLARARAQL